MFGHQTRFDLVWSPNILLLIGALLDVRKTLVIKIIMCQNMVAIWAVAADESPKQKSGVLPVATIYCSPAGKCGKSILTKRTFVLITHCDLIVVHV